MSPGISNHTCTPSQDGNGRRAGQGAARLPHETRHAFRKRQLLAHADCRDCLELCASACSRLAAIGFVQVAQAQNSESTYWHMHGRRGFLRVSAHQSNPRNHCVASMVFAGGKFHPLVIMSQERIDQIFWIAVGQFLERSIRWPVPPDTSRAITPPG